MDRVGYDGSLKFDTSIDEKGFNSGITKLGSIAKGGLKVVGAAVAGVATAFAGVSKAALDSVASLEQNIGGVETLFKDSAKTVIDNANNAYMTAGVSANKYMETVTSFSASLLQGLGGDTAEAARIADMAMVDMSDNANKFGTNMEDIQNAYQGFAKQNYTMLDNLKLGYGGTQAEMVRLINDSGILNEKIENLDNVSFSQIIQAIHKIQEDMGVTGTTSAEALTTIEGSVNAAKAAFDNFLNGSGSPEKLAESVITAGKNITNNLLQIVPRLAEELPKVGSLLMDRLSESLNSGKLNELMAVGGQIVSSLAMGVIQAIPGIITAAAQVITSFGDNINSCIPQLISLGGEILQALFSGMVQLLPVAGSFVLSLITELYNQLTAHGPGLLQKGYELLNNLITGFVQAIPEALPKILDFVQGIGDKLAEAAPILIQKGFELLGQLVEGIISAIPILIERVPEIISTFANIINDNFPTILAKGAELLGQFLLGILQAIPTLVANIPKIVSAIVDVIQAFNWLSLGTKIITFFKDGIMGMVGAVKNAGTSVYNAIKNVIANLPSNLKNIGKSAISDLGGAIRSGLSVVKNAASSIVSGIVNTITSLPGKMVSIGKNIIRGLWNGISDMTGWIIDKIGGFADSVVDSICSFFGIHSPSTLMKKLVGKNLALGVGVGFEDNIPDEEMTSSLYDSMRNMQKKVSGITSAPTTTTGGIISGGRKHPPVPGENVDIDYERIGKETAKAMEGMGVYLDKKPVGKIIAPEVNNELGKLERRKT